MNCRLIAAINLIISVIVLSCATSSPAEDAISNLSLGHDRFTLATPDPKIPALSVLGAKYGFNVSNGFRYYLGTGLAYTLLPEVRPADTVRLRTGVAAQAGASYHIGGNFSLNLDYKYLHIPPETQQVETPPQAISIGVKIKF